MLKLLSVAMAVPVISNILFDGFDLDRLAFQGRLFVIFLVVGVVLIWLSAGIFHLLKYFSYRHLLNKQDIKTESFKRWKDGEP
ncbi:hypothetical protein OVA03_15990 [Asticcacaulis sp. SL142]|uniref:hypothetical protein n=1 Tax=Asticcacaulis sp. SL142 TaxID=2995155 RepID=UPI00226CF8EC|nr:hypothetical protein [Asticcacaulis sp. SL142]WAC48172.1 hypothetical protein OVA03_15990 [Asticcacaulis sp. SL142]